MGDHVLKIGHEQDHELDHEHDHHHELDLVFEHELAKVVVRVGVGVYVLVDVLVALRMETLGIEGTRASETATLLIRSPSCGPLLRVKRSSDGLRIRRKR